MAVPHHMACGKRQDLEHEHLKAVFVEVNHQRGKGDMPILTGGSPGRRIYFGPTAKTILCSADPMEVIQLNSLCTLERALVLCILTYCLKDLTYPSSFAQILGLV
ncbi:hypothetical protein ISCGN_006582 [Ixodes scapularis]